MIFGQGRHKHYDDDFNWDTYTKDKYGPQQRRMDVNKDPRIDDRVFYDHDAAELKVGDAVVHPNHHSIYDIVGKLSVSSVFEVGCGGGDHLRNLQLLYPDVTVRGGDRSTEQLRFLKQRNPEVAEQAMLQDITMPFSTQWPKAELVYSQAVIMHIKTAVSHLNALANMFKLAEKYVVLMENYGCHPFVDDVKRLHEGGHIDWNDVHFHVHHHEGKPYCLLISKEPCSLPSLGDYFELPCAKKIRY